MARGSRIFVFSIVFVVLLGAVPLHRPGVVLAKEPPPLSDRQRDLLRSAGISYEVETKPSPPRLIAVRVRHNACPLCVALEPNMQPVYEEANSLGVAFVTIDLTSDAAQRQSALIIGALGLEGVWPDTAASLGTITFVTPGAKRVVHAVQTTEPGEIARGMREALSEVP